MFNVTFEGFGEDKTVNAIPGDILLRVGEANGLKINKDCEDGQCGSCAVKIEELTSEPLTYLMDEKEINTLIGMALLSKERAEELVQDTLSHDVRLACQYLVKGDVKVKRFR